MFFILPFLLYICIENMKLIMTDSNKLDEIADKIKELNYIYNNYNEIHKKLIQEYVYEYSKDYVEYIGKLVKVHFENCCVVGYFEGFEKSFNPYSSKYTKTPNIILYPIKKDGTRWKVPINSSYYKYKFIKKIELVD